ncbi:MAG: ABC transporter permease [Bacteroidetes bacterium]|nr:ABC transporter permease [Bacteroidota bacterium]
MKKHENFFIGLKELKTNRLRTFLTMLGIIFGVGAVIAMMSIGEGARRETLEQIELLGTNNIIIREKPITLFNSGSKASFSPGLNLNDAASIKKLNPFVEYVSPQRESTRKIIFKSSMLEKKVIGTYPDYVSINNARLLTGEYFKNIHIDNQSNVCVIGYGIKEQLFRLENPLGKQIKIDDLWFTVIGVMASKKVASSGIESLGLRDFNEDIYIPLTTIIYKLGNNTPGFMPMGAMAKNIFFSSINPSQNYDKISVDQIIVKIKNDASILHAENLISRILERRHYGITDYEVVVPEQLLEQKQKTQRIFNVVMGAIAGISLLVGGIGIMNIMLANILERTKEIGIRRAVGATKYDILSQFVYEALTISIAGGIVGIITGFILTSLITGYAEWRTAISPISIVLAFFVSVAVGLIFGIYPAKKAAEKDPIESLRYE